MVQPQRHRSMPVRYTQTQAGQCAELFCTHVPYLVHIGDHDVIWLNA